MRRITAVSTVIAILLLPAAASGASRKAAAQKVTLYILPKAEQFLNYSDARQRGYGSNPFGNFKDTSATAKNARKPPQPGDMEYLQFNVYKDPSLRQGAGVAHITCQFSTTTNAFCDATYELDNGTLVGSGMVDFATSSFQLAVVGGTGRYRDGRGVLQSTPAAHGAEHVAFDLT